MAQVRLVREVVACRENAAVRSNVCFGERGDAAWGMVDRQVWAEFVDTDKR